MALVHSPRISLVVPAYNEGRIIYANSVRLSRFLSREFPRSYELLVVDNGSTDETLAQARRVARLDSRVRVLHIAERGLGRALKRGFSEARGEWVFWFPADLAADLSFLHAARKHFRSADVILGSRRLSGSSVDSKRVRRGLSLVFNKLANALLSLSLTDSQCVKGFRRSMLEPVLSHARETGILFELELLVLLKRQGARMVELPVRVVDHRRDSKIRLDSVGGIFLDLLRLRRSLGRPSSDNPLVLKAPRD